MTPFWLFFVLWFVWIFLIYYLGYDSAGDYNKSVCRLCELSNTSLAFVYCMCYSCNSVMITMLAYGPFWNISTTTRSARRRDSGRRSCTTVPSTFIDSYLLEYHYENCLFGDLHDRKQYQLLVSPKNLDQIYQDLSYYDTIWYTLNCKAAGHSCFALLFVINVASNFRSKRMR